MDKTAVNIVTERLSLRGICEDDTKNIVKWRSKPDVYRYFKYPRKLTKKEHIQWYRNRYLSDESRIDFIAEETESGKPVGVFGIAGEDGNFKTAEISYILGEEYQGLGYAHEAVAGVMNWAFSLFKTKYFKAVIHKDNTVSLRFAKKEGFNEVSQEGDFLIFEKKL